MKNKPPYTTKLRPTGAWHGTDSMSERSVSNQEQPDQLFHYTSVGVLARILESKSIWATDLRFLNDGAEMKHGLGIVNSVIEDTIPIGKCSEALLQALPGALVGAAQLPVYVVSFSEDGDLLSQWRAYCPPARGVALGLSLTRLRSALVGSGFVLRKCSYTEAEQRSAVRRQVQEAMVRCERDATDSDNSAAILSARMLAYEAATFKHDSFSEEREWRILSEPQHPTGDVRPRFRESGSTLVPFVELRLDANQAGAGIAARIVIGPTPHPQLTDISVSVACEQFGEVSAQRIRSRTPFRTW